MSEMQKLMNTLPKAPSLKKKATVKPEPEEKTISFKNVTMAPVTDESLITVPKPAPPPEKKPDPIDATMTFVKEAIKEDARRRVEDSKKKIPVSIQKEATKVISAVLEPPKSQQDIDRQVTIRKILDYRNEFEEKWAKENKYRFASDEAYHKAPLDRLKVELHQIQVLANSTGVEPLIKETCVKLCDLFETVVKLSGADRHKYMEGYGAVVAIQMQNGYYDEEVKLIQIEYAEYFQFSPLQKLFAKMAGTAATHVLVKQNASISKVGSQMPAPEREKRTETFFNEKP